MPDAAPPTDDDAPSPLTTLFDVSARIAGRPIDRQAQLALRTLEMLGLVVRHEFAIALLDAKAKPLQSDPEDRRVDQLRFALVVRTGEHAEPIRRLIQKTVNEQTDQSKASLQRRSAQRWSYQELRDERIPSWCHVAWGQIGEFFVLTVGEGVWADIAAVAANAKPSLADDRFIAEGQAKRADAIIQVIVSIAGFQERLDPFVQGRASEFFKAWHADGVDRAHWQLGFEGRALYCEARFQHGNQTVERLYADPAIREARLLAAIPEGARYAIYHVPAGQILTRLFTSIYMTRGADVRQVVDAEWERVQREFGFDAERDLLSHLGSNIVLHNFPTHPLHLPLAMTSLIEVRDEPARVRKTIDTFCEGWREALDKAAEHTTDPAFPSLQHDSDGIWYIQFGLFAGVAWTTTDRFIVTSWSPSALRTYLSKIGGAIR